MRTQLYPIGIEGLIRTMATVKVTKHKTRTFGERSRNQETNNRILKRTILNSILVVSIKIRINSNSNKIRTISKMIDKESHI